MNNGSIKVVSGNANKIGSLYDPALDNCPHSKGSLCMIAHNQDRVFPCAGGHFQGCSIYLQQKKGGQVQ